MCSGGPSVSRVFTLLSACVWFAPCVLFCFIRSSAHTNKPTFNDKHVSYKIMIFERKKWCKKEANKSRVQCNFFCGLYLRRPCWAARFASVVVDLRLRCCFVLLTPGWLRLSFVKRRGFTSRSRTAIPRIFPLSWAFMFEVGVFSSIFFTFFEIGQSCPISRFFKKSRENAQRHKYLSNEGKKQN